MLVFILADVHASFKYLNSLNYYQDMIYFLYPMVDSDKDVSATLIGHGKVLSCGNDTTGCAVFVLDSSHPHIGRGHTAVNGPYIVLIKDIVGNDNVCELIKGAAGTAIVQPMHACTCIRIYSFLLTHW